MNTCPHCRAQPCLKLWRKLTLGPSASAHCLVCGLLVGVDAARAWLAMVPTLLLVILAGTRLLTDTASLLLLLPACLSLTVGLYAVWVPLVIEELSNARLVEQGRARVAASKRRGGV